MYADLLLGRGDPWGELIRLQTELEGRDAWDDRVAGLARRTRELERALRDRIAGELARRATA